MSWELPQDIPTEAERLSAYDEWCADNPGLCVLCNPHFCDDYCNFCEGGNR